MKLLIALSCVLAVASAKPGYLAAPLAYSAYSQPIVAARGFSYSTVSAHATPLQYNAVIADIPAVSTTLVQSAPVVGPAPIVAATRVVAPIPVVAGIEKTQYHAQDELGQASYGHSEAFQQHNAIQDAAGNKVGSFSYVAPDGQVVATNYIADALGYRVISNAAPVGPSEISLTPVETPEVVAARAAHLQAHEEIKHRSRRGLISFNTPLVSYTAPLAYAAPVQYTSPIHYPAIVTRQATLSTIVNNPGHAVSYRID